MNAENASVMEPKFVWPMLPKAKKLKVSEFGVRKGLSIQKAPMKEMRDPMVPEIHLACWTRLRVYKGLWE